MGGGRKGTVGMGGESLANGVRMKQAASGRTSQNRDHVNVIDVKQNSKMIPYYVMNS